MQYELNSFCTTENTDSKILVVLDKWYHFSSQWISVLIASFKTFYVWKSFAERIQVPDGQNKFTAKDFLNPSISISWLKHGLKFLNPTTLDLKKKVMLSFNSRFSILWVAKRNLRIERKIFCIGWRRQLWTWGGGHSAVLTAKKAVKWRIDADTSRVWACYLGSREWWL